MSHFTKFIHHIYIPLLRPLLIIRAFLIISSNRLANKGDASSDDESYTLGGDDDVPFESDDLSTAQFEDTEQRETGEKLGNEGYALSRISFLKVRTHGLDDERCGRNGANENDNNDGVNNGART